MLSPLSGSKFLELQEENRRTSGTMRYFEIITENITPNSQEVVKVYLLKTFRSCLCKGSMNPEGKSGKPPGRGKKYPAFTCNLNNPAISEGIFSRLSPSRQEAKQSPV